MTDEQLAEWEALAEKATTGAWFIVPYGDGDTFVVHSDDEQRIFFPPLPVGYSATAGSLGDPAQIESDMKFIAASRTAIPSLIAEVKRLRAVVADRAAVVEECARRVEAPAVAELVEANPGFMILQEYITRAETKEPPCPECGQPYVSARARGLAEDAAQRFGDIALEKNTPEGHYARGAIGQAERTAKDISALCDAADLLHGMVGLIDLLLNRDDLTDELRGVLLNNHRVVDARAALAKHAAKQEKDHG